MTWKESWKLYGRLLRYVKPHLLAFELSIVGYLIFAASSVATAQWLGWTVDAIESQDYQQLRILSPVLCVLIVVVRGIGGILGSYGIAHVSNHVVHLVRCEMMRHLLELPVAYFDKSTTGRIVSKITYDVAQITGAASNALTVIMREGLTVVGLLAALLVTDWKLSLTFLVVAPVVGMTVSAAARRFRKYSTKMQDSMGNVTQIANETVRGHRVVRTFGAKDFVSGKFSHASERNRKQNMQMALTQSISTPVIQILVAIAMAVLIWLAMSPEFFADKSAGDFVAFLTMAGLLAKPIRQLSQVNSVIQRGLAAAESIFELMDEKQEKDRGDYRVERASGRLEFRDVTFSYGRDMVALHNVSFRAEPGQVVALVGKSGSGKSTLVSLIPRFYDCNEGQILLDDVPVSAYTLEDLRRQISLVTQQVVLFNATVAENIAYGTLDYVDRNKLMEAARNAHAMEFIEQLPEGIDTEVGDEAGQLSGGQRQRIAIARALLKDAPVLILDEATSALDSESEQHIQKALTTLMKGRTTIVIAHRLSTIEKADLILVMDSGRIVESGSHSELLALGQQYAKLHRMQFSDKDNSES
ncbi:MAG: lipid A export permease/ATP-binding protein MsbA [Pseudomonadales bacterium]|nr:lipid A export permease/ATP-binding protein MsbA [Pseudomonadales bacterium]MCP5346101.1 lipid A export permease/ATP-binding protein MsbA [Pseudomonadales bacterium]